MKAPLVGKEKCKATQYCTGGYETVGHVEHGPATHPQKIGYLPGHDTVDKIAGKPGKDEKETMRQSSVSALQCSDGRDADANAEHCIHWHDPLAPSKKPERDSLVYR
jgi:hypothetical protein